MDILANMPPPLLPSPCRLPVMHSSNYQNIQHAGLLPSRSFLKLELLRDRCFEVKKAPADCRLSNGTRTWYENQAKFSKVHAPVSRVKNLSSMQAANTIGTQQGPAARLITSQFGQPPIFWHLNLHYLRVSSLRRRQHRHHDWQQQLSARRVCNYLFLLLDPVHSRVLIEIFAAHVSSRNQ
jgi:hypothetical protein